MSISVAMLSDAFLRELRLFCGLQDKLERPMLEESSRRPGGCGRSATWRSPSNRHGLAPGEIDNITSNIGALTDYAERDRGRSLCTSGASASRCSGIE